MIAFCVWVLLLFIALGMAVLKPYRSFLHVRCLDSFLLRQHLCTALPESWQPVECFVQKGLHLDGLFPSVPTIMHFSVIKNVLSIALPCKHLTTTDILQQLVGWQAKEFGQVVHALLLGYAFACLAE